MCQCKLGNCTCLQPYNGQLDFTDVCLVFYPVGKKRKCDDDDNPTSPKQICLTASAPEQGLISIATPQLIPNQTTTAVVTAPSSPTVPSNTPVYIVYKPVLQSAEKQSPKCVDPTTTTVIHPGMNGTTLIQGSNGHILNGATIIQAQRATSPSTICTATASPVVQPQVISPSIGATVIQPKKFNGSTVNVIQGSHPTAMLNNATIVQATPSFINGPTALIQANRQPAFIHPHSIATGLSFAGTSSQLVTTTATPRITEAISEIKSSHGPCTIDIRSLTKEGNMHITKSQPPPLVEVSEDKRKSPQEKLPNHKVQKHELEGLTAISASNTAATQSILVSPPTNGMQKVFIVAEKSDCPGTFFIPAPAPAATIDAAAMNTQAIIPMAYDQQVVTTMPIYRFGSFNTLQPIQILATPVAAGQNAS